MKRIHNIPNPVVLLLAFFIVSASLPQTQATTFTQTRYMLDGVTSFSNPTQLAFYDYDGSISYDYGQSLNLTTNNAVQFGIRVYHGNYNGTYYGEVTSGTPVAVVERSTVGEGLQNATWTDSATTPLNRTSLLEIQVKYRRKVGTFWTSWGAWTGKLNGYQSTYDSEPLGALQLINSTWNVYYFTAMRQAGTYKWFEFYWGNNGTSYGNRVEGISYDDGVTDTFSTDFSTGMFLGATGGGIIALIVGFAISKKH